MGSYSNGSVSVGATPTLVCTVAPESDGVLIQNAGTTAVFLGGSAVAASGANQGIQVGANATQLVPSIGGAPHDLYAITASGSEPVVYLFPVA